MNPKAIPTRSVVRSAGWQECLTCATHCRRQSNCPCGHRNVEISRSFLGGCRCQALHNKMRAIQAKLRCLSPFGLSPIQCLKSNRHRPACHGFRVRPKPLRVFIGDVARPPNKAKINKSGRNRCSFMASLLQHLNCPSTMNRLQSTSTDLHCHPRASARPSLLRTS